MKKILYLFLWPSIIFGQTIDKSEWKQFIGVQYLQGSVFVHTTSVKSVEGARPIGFTIDIGKQMNDHGTYMLTDAYPNKGFSFSYFDYGTPILGKGYIADYFLQPVYRISNHVQFQFKGSIGLSYLTNPFDSLENPTNKNYSLYVNPYLHLGTGLNILITKKITLSGGVNFHHISNGSFHQPNSGLNWTTVSASLNYFPQGNQLKKYSPNSKQMEHSKTEIEAGFFYVPEQGYNYKLNAQRKYATGFFVQANKKISKIDALNIAAELYHNEFVNITSDDVYRNPNIFAGIYGGHEFLMGRILFSQQIGAYLTAHSSYFSYIYTRWGLRYQLDKHLYIGFNLKVHADEADFIDGRISYRF